MVYDRYGAPDVLRIEEVPTPTPGPGQVLVEVVATSINLSDWEGLRGTPFYARIGGLRTPGRRTLGIIVLVIFVLLFTPIPMVAY